MNLKALLDVDSVYVHTGMIDAQSTQRLLDWLPRLCRSESATITLTTFGGNVEYALAIHDAIRLMSASGVKINLVALGACQSSGVTIMTSVDVDRRYSGPNTRFLIHAIVSGGDETRIKCDPQSPGVEVLKAIKDSAGIDLTESYQLQEALIELLARETRLSAAELREMFESDKHFSAGKAVECGLIGHILED